MDDLDQFVDRGSGCIGRVNETKGFSIELFAVEFGGIAMREAVEFGA